MTDNIFLCNSTEFIADKTPVGIFDYLLNHLNSLDDLDIFESVQIIVPNQAISAWLRDNIALHNHICANINFVVLLGPLLQKIYLDNNPDAKFLDLGQIKFIIYDYLLTNQIYPEDGGDEVNAYIYTNNQLNKTRVFLLATQLASIIQEYIYLRCDEIITLNKAPFPKWQKQLISHILDRQEKTYIDIYKYFMDCIDLGQLKLPKRLFIFGLTSLYPSQLRIIKKLSTQINVYWYYQSPTLKYYGDLLSNKARQKIEQKLLKYPDLTLDDLYLNEGNPLLSGLAQQSREFIELLRVHDIEPFSIDEDNCYTYNSSLELLQYDIKNINYRVDKKYRLLNDNSYYADPEYLDNIDNSIKINSCHNKMREVQVMFNEIAQLLNNNPDYTYKDILITAPNIENYVNLIEAVFDNEYVSDLNGNNYKIQYNITGHKRYKNYELLECLKLIINLPYELPVSFLIDVLSQGVIQNALDISESDIYKTKKWLAENNINFGYDGSDYANYGFDNYDTHSLTQLLNRLACGAFINNEYNRQDILPLYNVNNIIVPLYLDLEFIDIKLINKLIKLIELFKNIRDSLYISKVVYQDVEINQFVDIIRNIFDTLTIDYSLNYAENFIHEISQSKTTQKINLVIFNQLLDDYIQKGSSRILFNGCITVASMHLIRSIPYKCVYVLGLNFGEYPNTFNPNKLSILSKEWYLADRNYYIEDKQIFLDTILAAKEKLYLSYIGRDETSNYDIYPSPVLSLVMDTIYNSVINYWINPDNINDGINNELLICQNSLHPFNNQYGVNYSKYWENISHKSADQDIDLRWDFNLISPLNLATDEINKYKQIEFKSLVRTFLYTNVNLYKVLDYDTFNNEIILNDELDINAINRESLKTIYIFFEKYSNLDKSTLLDYFAKSGLISYKDFGVSQFDIIYDKYLLYKEALADLSIKEFSISYTLAIKDNLNTYEFIISGTLIINNAHQIVIPITFGEYCTKDKDIENTNKAYNEKIALKYKIEALILLYLLDNSDIHNIANDDENYVQWNKLNKSSIIYRDINIDGSIVNKSLVLDSNIISSGLNSFLMYYIRSLTNPVLIVPSILKKAGQDKYASRVTNNLPLEDKLFKEFDLNKSRLKSDILFDQIIDDYFNYTKINKNTPNDIIKIYSYLETLRIE